MKIVKRFQTSDKVFAKVRGYPPWPARVEEVTDGHTKNAKYKVFFYGTGETATCKVDELFTYNEHKEKYGNVKRKAFHEGIQQLEAEMDNDLNPQQEVPSTEVATEPEVESTPVAPVVETPQPLPAPPALPAPNVDSDLEAGPLVIDEGDKKKQLKRKSLATPVSSLDSSEPKKKRARGKSWVNPQSTPKQETGTDSQGEEAVNKEVVSRSGRKIKPKRFADFSSSDEFDIENRSRGNKSKIDESMESELSQSSIVSKKRISLEKDDKKHQIAEKTMQQYNQKLRWLRTEHELLSLEYQIKSNLPCDSADVDECMQAMDEILKLPIDPLMLKKHSHVVETVRKLRGYIGNLSKWKLGEDESLIFKQKADQIRQKADQIYAKFEALFAVPQGQTFWRLFFEQVNIFNESVKDMTEEKVFALMCDPVCPEVEPEPEPETAVENSPAVSNDNTSDMINQSVMPTAVAAM